MIDDGRWQSGGGLMECEKVGELERWTFITVSCMLIIDSPSANNGQVGFR